MALAVCLVSMPWQSLESPSLPLGLLRSAAVRAGREAPMTYYGNLRWAEFLMERTDGAIGVADYHEIAENGLFHGLGDWAFAGVLHDDPEFGVAALEAYATERGLDIGLVREMREHADAFVDLVVEELLALEADLVGFSTTFMQNVPSLSVARRLRARAPEIAVLFGGGNCDGPMGAALQRNFPYVDYVVRGEGEKAFPALLAALDDGSDLSEVPGLCWWAHDGSQAVNPQPRPLAPGELLVPDFDDWFARLDESAVQSFVEPKLVLEAARGCWWGEKHHCTFCGLNGTLMEFRSKRPETIVDEIGSLIERHQVLDVIMVDNIIDNRYFRTVLPMLEERGWDLRIHYEVKSNLRPAEIAALRRVGAVHVQPGIESLVSPVLKIMDKGVTGVQNVRTLRDCESQGLTVSWNWLYGFPHERIQDYERVIAQLPALVHLQPPAGAARILLERFSPYFERPELGFPGRTTAAAYRHVYALPEERLQDMVYLFDTEPAGITDEQVKALHDQLNAWSDAYHDSSLSCTECDGALVVEDRRTGWPERTHRIEAPEFVAAYRELEAGRSAPALRERLAELGHHVAPDRLAEWLGRLADDGLVFEEHGRWITLATSIEPIKVAV
ncbi:RiPP maturation radical SAM C-methyltransferase [Kitasatospora sp. NPDC048194]|uniref:RiPP maturation radical SAM C-methyltransferase n=1 Tax=Kitasatospora sp. NPDC048194 TaxID=3364045 RepID=UPI003714B225